MKRIVLLLVSLSVIMLGTEGACSQEDTSAQQNIRWLRGNTHCHTLNSDGDSSPWDIAEWYKDHGYDFVVITDHNFLTSVDRLNAVYGEDEEFLVIPGVEVSQRFGDKRVHLCALNPGRLIFPEEGSTILETLVNNIRVIREAGSIPIIAHPNYKWSFGSVEMKQLENCRLFELFNGHPYINNTGWGEHQSTEEMWDEILSSGKVIYGVASDDAHFFKDPWDRTEAHPNQGWIIVEADERSAEAIVKAMEQGKFYSSTGIELEDYFADEASVRVEEKQEHQTQYRIQFIGRMGQVFHETLENPAAYRFTGEEQYIRVRIEDSNGNLAWTQPVEVGKTK